MDVKLVDLHMLLPMRFTYSVIYFYMNTKMVNNLSNNPIEDHRKAPP